MAMLVIKLAGLPIGIESRYEMTARLCQAYVCEEAPLFTVWATEAEIAAEKQAALFAVSDAYAESVCIYRNLCRRLPAYEAFLFHSAVVECDARAYAFAAPSGTGKSTHASLWLRHFGERARILNGDKPIFRRDKDGFFAFGTPWCGKEGWQVNASASLEAICFLVRGQTNRIERLEKSEAVSLLLPQILMPERATDVTSLFPLLNALVEKVPCYQLQCNVSEEAVEVAYAGMRPV